MSYDGTILAYHQRGAGVPLICLPGGPGRASSYLGNLGGLDQHRQLLLLDNRGTGDSAAPTDESSYRMDRLPDDLEAFRHHLGLERFDLLAHSAGAAVAMLYAARFPERLSRLALVTPGIRAVPIDFDEEGYTAALRSRAAQPWFAAAKAAEEATEMAEDFAQAIRLRTGAAPFSYATWGPAQQAHAAGEPAEMSIPAAVGFVDRYRRDDQIGVKLATVSAPTLVLAGGADPAPTQRTARAVADLFPHSRLVVQPNVGHFPWVDDPAGFVRIVTDFLNVGDPR